MEPVPNFQGPWTLIRHVHFNYASQFLPFACEKRHSMDRSATKKLNTAECNNCSKVLLYTEGSTSSMIKQLPPYGRNLKERTVFDVS